MALISRISQYQFDVEYKDFKFEATLIFGFGVLNDALDFSDVEIEYPKNMAKEDKEIVSEYLNNYKGDYEAETITIFQEKKNGKVS
jgi:hypothetical protein